MRVAQAADHEGPRARQGKENSECDNKLAKEDGLRELEVPVQ